jgi:hypothetical protein
MFTPTIEVIAAQPRVLDPPDLSFEGLLERFPGLAKAEAVCLTGSVAAGWGNQFSDIDIYAFSDGKLDLPDDETSETWPGSDQGGLRWHNWMGVYDHARVDLKIWPTDTLAHVLAPYLGTEVEFCSMGHGLQDFVYRLSIAKPLKNEDFFERMRALLDSSSYQRSLARYRKAISENALMDVAGQLASGDHMTARLSAAIGAAIAADACLLLAGELCRGDKWLLRRLKKKPECGIGVDEYRSVVLTGPRPGESDGDCALRIARWAQAQLVQREGAFLAGA